MQITYENEDGDEVCLELPHHFEVCSDCQGHGSVLAPGIREHAYTPEEFNEAYSDDEERAEYFTRGGRYDVACPSCNGLRVEMFVNESALTDKQRPHYEAWKKSNEARAQSDAEDARTRFYETGGRE